MDQRQEDPKNQGPEISEQRTEDTWSMWNYQENCHWETLSGKDRERKAIDDTGELSTGNSITQNCHSLNTQREEMERIHFTGSV